MEMVAGKQYRILLQWGCGKTSTLKADGLVDFGHGGFRFSGSKKLDPKKAIQQATDLAKTVDQSCLLDRVESGRLKVRIARIWIFHLVQMNCFPKCWKRTQTRLWLFRAVLRSRCLGLKMRSQSCMLDTAVTRLVLVLLISFMAISIL